MSSRVEVKVVKAVSLRAGEKDGERLSRLVLVGGKHVVNDDGEEEEEMSTSVLTGESSQVILKKLFLLNTDVPQHLPLYHHFLSHCVSVGLFDLVR